MDISALFKAKTIAVIGASNDETKVGHQILSNLAQNSSLTLYPINLKESAILGLTCYPHITDTPTSPDLAIISIPATYVNQVIDECIVAKVGSIVLLTAGFKEVGEAGKLLELEIVKKCKDANITLLGPNTMGYIDTHSNLYASFGPKEVSSGNIAVISQSGAMLSALFEEYHSSSTGISFAISLGNKGGITENEALEYAKNDPNTKIIVIYLESLSDPQSFLRLAKTITPIKPVYLLKGGVTESGSKLALSHTASLATSSTLLSALMMQAGVVQLDNFEMLVRSSVASSLVSYLPEKIGIITNAGGLAVVLTDHLSSANINIESTKDLLGDATALDYETELSNLSNEFSVDSVISIVSEQSTTDLSAITNILAKKRGKLLRFAVIAGGDELDQYRIQLKDSGVIVARYPNEIADILRALKLSKSYLFKKIETQQDIATSQNSISLDYKNLSNLLNKYNFATPCEVIVSNIKDIESINILKYPLIAKTTNLKLLHKAKLGAVIQDLIDLASSTAAYSKLQQWGSDVVFQEKVTGVEVLLGAHFDPYWGWYMAVGMGGSLSNTYDDRTYIFLPATPSELDSGISKTKLNSLLTGAERRNLQKAMESFVRCVFETSGIKELEINPLFVSDTGVVAADLKCEMITV